jgi:preprotein translocase subunit SecY
MFLVWLGELITENGIGNGVSLIIFGGIVAGVPTLFPQIAESGAGEVGILGVLGIGFVLLTFMVYFQEAQRRIPVQYARSVFRSGRMYRQSGQTHIPLRVNSAGMIPLIFAFSLMVFPSAVATFVRDSTDAVWLQDVSQWVIDWFQPRSWGFIAFTFLMVVIFTFFYTLVIFQQQNLAENLQKQGGFVPGIRPGRPTAEYIMRVLIRITWGGAIFLGIVAIVPTVATRFTDVQSMTLSSTGLIIVVGVVLDTMRQLEAQLMMRDYEGFIR